MNHRGIPAHVLPRDEARELADAGGYFCLPCIRCGRWWAGFEKWMARTDETMWRVWMLVDAREDWHRTHDDDVGGYLTVHR